MASAAELAIVMTAKDEASRALQGLTDKTGGLNKAFQTLKRVGAVAAVAAIAAVGAAVTKGVLSAMDFEKGMAEVHTLLGKDFPTKSWDKLNKDMLALSKEMGVSTDELIPALYQAISAGVPPENAISFLRDNTKLAIGGVTDLSTAVDLSTTVLNAWGLAGEELGRVNDVLFAGVKAGKTTVAELGAAMFQVAPIAAAAGVSIEEVTAGLATLTASGVPTAQAATFMGAAINELGKGGTKANVAFQEVAGVGFREFIAQGGNTVQAMELLKKKAEEDGVAVSDLFGSMEAGKAVSILAGENLQTYAANLDSATNAAGLTDDAFQIMNETTARQWDMFKNKLNVALIQLGQKVLPIVLEAIDKVSSFISKELLPALKEWWAEHGPAIVGTLEDIGDVLDSILLPALKALGEFLLDDVFPAIRKVFDFLRDNKEILAAVGIAIMAYLVPGIIAWTAATIANTVAHIALAAATLLAYAPIIALIAAIALIAYGIIQLIKHWDDVTAALGKFKDFVIDAFSSIKDKVLGVVDSFVGFLKDHWKEIVTGALLILFPPAGGLFFIITHFGEIKDKVLGIITTVKDTLLETFESLRSGIADKMRAIGDAIKSGVNDFIGFFERGINNIIRAWNSLEFKLPKVDLGPLGSLGGGSIGTPDIPTISLPRLQAGAIIPPGVVMPAILHGPEAVIPLGRGGTGDSMRPLFEEIRDLLKERSFGEFNIVVSGTTEGEMARAFGLEMRRMMFDLGL